MKKKERDICMKNMKKLLGIFLAMAMVLVMAIPTLAATVTVSDNSGLSNHDYYAYQIFAGTQETSEGALGDVTWGDGINSSAFLTALTTDTTVIDSTNNTQMKSLFASCKDAADVAKVLGENNADDSAMAKQFAKLAYANKAGNGTKLTTGTTTSVSDGYYLIVDQTEVADKDDVRNPALLQVTRDITIADKNDKPSVEKKVKEDDKYTQDGGYGTGYNDVADYNIGDSVPFELIGAVPNMSNYDTYKYVFHDSMSTGLTLNNSSVKVYVADDTKGTNKSEITSSFTITPASTSEDASHSLTVSIDNLKSVSGVSQGKYIIVEYTATLNTSAVIGLDGNPNEVYLEYSNNPDQGGTGKTTTEKAIVFTYELDTTKVDGTDNTKKLAGAEFKLHDSNNKWAIVDTTSNQITGWADTEADGTTLTSSDSKDNKGLFVVKGLDDGTYYLKEEKAPSGYNKLTNEITVVITATTSNVQNWDGTAATALTKLEVTADGEAGTTSLDNGSAAITVANNAGSTLPETGGIGTTIFYVVGAVLVLGAVVLLVTRKRVDSTK